MVCVRCGLAVDRQKGPLPGRSLFLDIAGLDVQARKNILRVLRDARERERSLSMEVERLRAALFHQRRATGLLGRLRERLHGKDRAVA